MRKGTIHLVVSDHVMEGPVRLTVGGEETVGAKRELVKKEPMPDLYPDSERRIIIK
jgi:hypothetical protein